MEKTNKDSKIDFHGIFKSIVKKNNRQIEGRKNMATSVQITLIICATLIAIMLISNKDGKDNGEE